MNASGQPPSAADPWTGRLVGGRWRILSLLDDSGGMASVYLADDTRLPRQAVVKMPKAAHQNAEFRERFDREAKWHAQADNLHVVHILDRGEEAGTPFLVLQYLPGGNLTAWCQRNPAMLADPRLHYDAWLLPIARALDAVAAQGIVHRDVKPSNILFDAGGQAYLSDFGIVRAGDDATMTGTGMFIGTLQFMSPEQCQPEAKRSLDGRSDQFGLAVTVYQTLSGWRYPVEDDTAVVYAAKFGHVPMTPPRTHDPRIPPAVEAAVMRALAVDRERRFGSSVEFAKAVLEAFGAAGQPREPERSTPASPPRVTQALIPEPPPRHAPKASRPAFPVRIWRWFQDLPDLALAAGLARFFLALMTTLWIMNHVASSGGEEGVILLMLLPSWFASGWGGRLGRGVAIAFFLGVMFLTIFVTARGTPPYDFQHMDGKFGENGEHWLWTASFAWTFVVGTAGGWLFIACASPAGMSVSPIVSASNLLARVAIVAPALYWVDLNASELFNGFEWRSVFFLCCLLPCLIVSLALSMGFKPRSAAAVMIATTIWMIGFEKLPQAMAYQILILCWLLALAVVASAGPGPGCVDSPASETSHH